MKILVDCRNEKLICPNCGKEKTSAWGVSINNCHTLKCEHCTKEFIFMKEFIEVYTTYRVEGD